MENDVTYWRNRAEFYQRQTVEMEERIESMEEVAGERNAVIASLKARLKELEDRCSQHSS